MTEKAKRTGLIIAGILLCAVLVIGIAGRFTSAPTTDDPTISDNGPDAKDPLVDIDTPNVKVEIKAVTSTDKDDPGKGADSSGTEQTIQGTPTKPDAPEKPKAPGQVEDDHKAEDVPASERKTEDGLTPHIRNSPPPSPKNPSPPREARIPPVRCMCRASAMWTAAEPMMVVRWMICMRTEIKSVTWAAGINRIFNQHGAVRNDCAVSFSRSFERRNP